MPGRIQTNPVGLLALLGLKTTGVNPSVFPDHVQGVIEVGKRYSVGTLTLVTETGVLDNGDPGDQYLRVVVPNGELWDVSFLSVDFGVAAGGVSCKGAFGMRLSSSPGAPEIYLSPERLYGPTGATPPDYEEFVDALQFNQQFLMPPGSHLFWRCWENTNLGTEGITAGIAALYTVTPI